MAVALWSGWAEEWALFEKVSFNGYTKEITVNSGVDSLSIADDVYSAWVRWTDRESQFLPAMRFTGLDPIPGGQTGAVFFLINGWKLIYDPRVVAVSGVLYSDDYPTAYFFTDGNPVYPATVSALVNQSVSFQNVVTGDLSSVGTKAEIAEQVRAELSAELAKILEMALLHGLTLGSPLVVSETERTAGGIVQTISVSEDGTTTVTRTE